jgi:hypothetical protein
MRHMMAKVGLAWYAIEYTIRPYLKPSMFISFGIAWIVTNGGWYVLAVMDIPYVSWFARGYVALLWFPFTIEKPITFAIAVWIQKKLFVRRYYDNIKEKSVSRFS